MPGCASIEATMAAPSAAFTEGCHTETSRSAGRGKAGHALGTVAFWKHPPCHPGTEGSSSPRPQDVHPPATSTQVVLSVGLR